MAKVEFLTTDEYADLFQKNPQQVRDMCKDGRIKATKVGKTWRIPYAEPPDVIAEEEVRKAVSKVFMPCMAVIEAASEALDRMKAELKMCLEELGNDETL